MWSRWEEMDMWGEAEKHEETKHPPVADAGEDKVVFDTVTLDGSASTDSDGTIVAWDWVVKNRHNPSDVHYASGVTAVVSELKSGFYDVSLTVTDNDNLVDTDNMLLAVYAKRNVGLAVKTFSITKDKRSQNTTTSLSGAFVGFPTLSLAGPTVHSRITVELFDPLGDGVDLIMSETVPLTVTDTTSTVALAI